MKISTTLLRSALAMALLHPSVVEAQQIRGGAARNQNLPEDREAPEANRLVRSALLSSKNTQWRLVSELGRQSSAQQIRGGAARNQNLPEGREAPEANRNLGRIASVRVKLNPDSALLCLEYQDVTCTRWYDQFFYTVTTHNADGIPAGALGRATIGQEFDLYFPSDDKLNITIRVNFDGTYGDLAELKLKQDFSGRGKSLTIPEGPLEVSDIFTLVSYGIEPN